MVEGTRRWGVVGVAVVAALGACRIDFDELRDPAADAAADAADPGPGASCLGLAPLCGPAGNRSCCEVQDVPGGSFLRSFDPAADGLNADSTNPATVSELRLDVYEVTVGRFRKFVEAGRGTQATAPAPGDGAHALAGSGWDPAWTAQLPADTAALVASATCSNFPTWTATAGANEALPINCIDWYVAMAFCTWDGGYLPTEAEWNFAASGGDDQRAYPWSAPATDTAIGCDQANIMGCPSAGPQRAGLSSPGGDGRWDHADLAGNVWEWTLDWNGSYPNPCTDCAALATGTERAVRGGSFVTTSPTARVAHRFSYPPASHHDNVGVRCARSR